jgi:CheY-like chemotaxis protein
MAFRVLIIEDKPSLRSQLLLHLSEPFHGETQHAWSDDWVKHAENHLEVKALNTATVEALVEAKDEAAVREVLAEEKMPQLIITDLALSDDEVEELDDRGGTEVTGSKDPTEQLALTTGFQILKAMAPEVTVIATTYASNPRVIEACWEAGAHAVIAKPATDEQMTAFFMLWQYKDNPTAELTESQKRKGRRWRRRIEAYLRAISQEVLKAVQAKALSEMQSVVPRQLPYWLALDHERLEGRRIEGTSLMMMEILGFRPLAELAMAKPDSLFKLVNAIWDEIQPVLENAGAEVNHFSGDLGLIFHGVYDEAEGQRGLEETLRCGAEVSALFTGDKSPARMRLIQEIWQHYDGEKEREMVKHVESSAFGIRIVSIQPMHDHALYGKVGALSRWQHTTLSRYFDLLQAARTEIARVESRWTPEPEETFLLFDKRATPETNGFDIKSLDKFLRSGQAPFERELLQWEIHRVLNASNMEYA